MNKTAKIVITVLSCLLVATGITTGIFLGKYVRKTGENQDRIDQMYEKSYYETLDSLKNAETKLSKVNIVGSKVQRELLGDVWKECGIAVTNLGQLGRDGEETETVTKFLNQVGDYCYYLMGKLSAGEEITKSEKDNVKTFRTLLSRLHSDLAAVGDSMVEDDKISASTLSDLSAVRNAIKSYSSIDYPELIYDGPFSDGLNDREAKFLKGQSEIDETTAKEKIQTWFPQATGIETEGEASSSIACYVIGFESDGIKYSAFVTRQGGSLASLNGYGETDDPQVDENECVNRAKTFLQSVGYDDMECVWVYNNHSTVYVNFAYCKNNVVYYPDLIKVKVSANDGKILGAEGMNYLYNHGDRTVDFDASGESRIVVPSELTVSGTRYCVIPTEWNKEIYCKEIAGEYDGSKYYLYYDLSTGDETRALVVIDEDGDKLI